MKAKALREYSDVSGCSSVTCSSLSSPQRKPGSGRLKGQSLLSSDTCVYDCQQKSESEKSHIRRCNVFGSHDMLAVRNKKNNKRLKVFVPVAVYVPEEPDVYENKDMLCSGHCVCVDVFFLLFFTKQLVTQEKFKFRMLNL